MKETLLLLFCLFSFSVAFAQHNNTRALKELALHETDSVIIDAINPRDSTGILLKKNCSYTFEVKPDTSTWTDGELLGKFTAKGKLAPVMLIFYPFARMPFVKWYALLGSIDNKRSTYFKIGVKRKNYSPKRDGELVCFANDVPGFKDHWYLHNNKGQMKLFITRVR